jgi:hypothetical protein
VACPVSYPVVTRSFDLIFRVVKCIKLTTHLRLVPMLRTHGGIPPFTLHLNDVVLNLKVIHLCYVYSIKSDVNMLCLNTTLFIIFPFYVLHIQSGDDYLAS